DYLGAEAGAVFIHDGERYRRAATYGVPDGAALPETFDAGTGLLGQAARDGRGRTLAEVPDDYLYFGSGLGRAKPRHLVITPARIDGQVNAVVELGFLARPDPRLAELLDRAAESIGVAVRSAKYRARLQELLEETRRQAEELQSQSEELRAANEELEEQTRALQDSQARLEQQQQELEETNLQLE